MVCAIRAQEWGVLLKGVTSDTSGTAVSFPPKPFSLAVATYSAVPALLLALAIRAALTMLGSP
jgi:hypothetical protein